MNRTAQIVRATVVAMATAAVHTGVAAADATGTSGPPALQQSLAQLVAAGAPGTILLTRDGNRTTRLTSGLADVDTKTPMRSDDRFRIASLTKTFVATIVLQLADEQKLSLDDSIQHSESLPKRFAPLYFRLLTRAYCERKP